MIALERILLAKDTNNLRREAGMLGCAGTCHSPLPMIIFKLVQLFGATSLPNIMQICTRAFAAESEKSDAVGLKERGCVQC